MRYGKHLGIAGSQHAVDDRKGELTLRHVVSSRLSYLLRVIIIEDIITYLEDYSKGLTKLCRCFYIGFSGSGTHRSNSTARLKESCCLLLYHVVISLLGDVLTTIAGELQYLAVCQCLTETREVTDDAVITRLRHIEKGGGEDIIAHEHCHLIIVERIDRLLSATLSRLIHYVIVHETGSMQQLKSYCRMLCGGIHLAKAFCHQQDKHRTHTLSSTLANMIEHGLKHSVGMRKGVIEEGNKVLQLLFYRFSDM